MINCIPYSELRTSCTILTGPFPRQNSFEKWSSLQSVIQNNAFSIKKNKLAFRKYSIYKNECSLLRFHLGQFSQIASTSNCMSSFQVIFQEVILKIEKHVSFFLNITNEREMNYSQHYYCSLKQTESSTHYFLFMKLI